MADNKKYYYLKLKDNFFDSEEIIVLQDMPNGYLYSDILMKLYLRSLKNNGKLMFNENIPYSVSTLSKVVRHKENVVSKALKTFQDLGLIEVLNNGAIYMLNIQNFIGQSSSEADRQREYQARIALEKNEKNCKISNNISNGKPTPKIEINTNIQKEREQTKSNTSYDDSRAHLDFDSLWRSIIRVYPITRNTYPGKKVFKELLLKEENPIEYTKVLCEAINLYKENYVKEYPNDITLVNMPTLCPWLKNEAEVWIDKVRTNV